MSLTTKLHEAGAGAAPSLDHEHLQRAGRRRRRIVRSLSGVSVVAVIGVAAVGVQHLPPPTAGIPSLGAPSGGDAAPSEEPDPEAVAAPTEEPDPEVVAAFGELPHDEVVTELHRRLDEHPQRPAGLDSISQHVDADGAWQVRELTGEETAEDFPVVTVLHPDFDPSSRHETPAFEPTWTQEAARRALDAFEEAGQFRYVGVGVDARGRTVLIFGATPAAHEGAAELPAETYRQRVHVDPATGYTAGTAFLADEVTIDVPDADAPDDRGQDDEGPGNATSG